MTPKELVENYGRAKLGIDGNCGYALLGPNIQEGECEFVAVDSKQPTKSQLLVAARRAMWNLRERLNMPDLSYYTDDDFWGL